ARAGRRRVTMRSFPPPAASWRRPFGVRTSGRGCASSRTSTTAGLSRRRHSSESWSRRRCWRSARSDASRSRTPASFARRRLPWRTRL
ncbi:hypothetical protein ACHAWF_000170, partial [Thalassiosira exigua]